MSQLRKLKDVHEEYELDSNPESKGDVTCEVVVETQVVDTRIACQRRSPHADQPYHQPLSLLLVDLVPHNLLGTFVKLIPDYTV